ncbi:preprotein translocase subunit SecG [Candidatus Curtissbacteria bacterium]|nr:preprotein translocase subunit SecG [Candidatus Curtissbacteria bacterium]
MKSILLVLQIAIAAGLVVVVLLQAEGTGIGSVFGGSGGFYRSKRGVEKLFLYLTIILAILLLALSILLVVIK